jgi:hypothetical protein
VTTTLPWWPEWRRGEDDRKQNTLAPLGPVNGGSGPKWLGPGVRVTGNGPSKVVVFRPGVRVNDLFRNHVREQLMCPGTGIIIRL